jgi:hypothetical protein
MAKDAIMREISSDFGVIMPPFASLLSIRVGIGLSHIHFRESLFSLRACDTFPSFAPAGSEVWRACEQTFHENSLEISHARRAGTI